MPSAASNLDAIESTLKASLSQNKQLDQHVVSAMQRVLMHHIQFVAAVKPHTLQLSSLKSKYILLQPKIKDPVEASSSKKVKSVNNREAVDSLNSTLIKEEHDSNNNFTMNRPGPSGDAGVGDGFPSPKVVIYPPEQVRLEWRQIHRIGAGLVNMGNTCFFNSTLQCLTYTAPLVNYCFSEEHPKSCKQQNACLMCELRRHIKSAFQHSGHAFKPQMMLQKLKMIAKHMRWGRQEDAHEFLRYLVDGLQRACLNGYAKLDKFSKETTVINQIFGGFLRSQVQCMKCTAKSNTFDPFMDLSLDIKGVHTVEDALAKFVKAETLDSENAYKCEKCHQKVPAQKRFSIHKIPNVLTLQLNRFDYNRISGKINRHIQFPEKLNIRPYMSQKQGEPVYYYLYGVLIHSGFHCNSGHYYCYVKAPSKVWYLMNDSMVQTVPASRVFQAEAYLLFYSRAQSSVSQMPGKAPFIGPTSNGLKTPGCFPAVNGSYGKSTSSSSGLATPVRPGFDVGVPVPRQMILPGNGASAANGTGACSALLQNHQKISFGITKPFQQLHQSNTLFIKQKSESETVAVAPPAIAVEASSAPRIVMQIKKGKVTTIEKSPDGKSKIVNGDSRKASVLVPYEDDSDSEEESTSSGTKDKDRKSCEKGSSNLQLAFSNVPSLALKISPRKEYSHIEDAQKQIVTAGVMNSKPTIVGMMNSKSGAADVAPSRKDLHLKLNRENNMSANVRRISVDTQGDLFSPSKVNAVNSSWFVQRQDSANSPSLGSNSSTNSNQSINSTTEWHVEEVGGVKINPAGDRKLHHAGWTVTQTGSLENIVHHSTSQDVSQKLDSVFKRVKLKGIHSSDSDKVPSDSLKRVCLGSVVHSIDSVEENNTVAAAKMDNSSANPDIDKNLEHQHKVLNGDCVEEETNSESCAKHLPQGDEVRHSVDISDKDTLLANGITPDTDKVFHKKHKKKKHKHEKEREQSKIKYEEFQATDTSPVIKHKKKKHKSHERDNSDSDRHERKRKDHLDDSDDAERHSSKKQRKAESSEEYTWAEKTKESLMVDREKKSLSSDSQVPVHACDRFAQNNAVPSHHNGNNVHTPKLAWDGSRKHQVVEELEKHPTVSTWEGHTSEASIEMEREQAYRKRWVDNRDEELDRGKVKKVKDYHRDKHSYYSFNPFQKYMNDRNQDKRRGFHHKHQSYNNTGYAASPFNHSYNDHSSYHHGNNSNHRDYHNRNNQYGGHHGFHRTYSHQNYHKRY